MQQVVSGGPRLLLRRCGLTIHLHVVEENPQGTGDICDKIAMHLPCRYCFTCLVSMVWDLSGNAHRWCSSLVSSYGGHGGESGDWPQQPEASCTLVAAQRTGPLRVTSRVHMNETLDAVPHAW